MSSAFDPSHTQTAELAADARTAANFGVRSLAQVHISQPAGLGFEPVTLLSQTPGSSRTEQGKKRHINTDVC